MLKYWPFVSRYVLDPGILFGLMNAAYLWPHGHHYSFVSLTFTALSVIARSHGPWKHYPGTGLYLLACGQVIVCAMAFILKDFSDAIVIAIPIGCYALAVSINAYEISDRARWYALPHWLRRFFAGEIFAGIGTGALLYFVNNSGLGYTVTAISTAISLAVALYGRSDWSRFAMGAGAALTGAIVMVEGGAALPIVASFLLAAANFRVGYLKREHRKQSITA